MLFLKKDLQQFTHVTVLDEILDPGMWPSNHHRVFKNGPKFYETFYTIGAAGYTMLDAYTGQPDMIDCPEVAPKTLTTTIFVRV